MFNVWHKFIVFFLIAFYHPPGPHIRLKSCFNWICEFGKNWKKVRIICNNTHPSWETSILIFFGTFLFVLKFGNGQLFAILTQKLIQSASGRTFFGVNSKTQERSLFNFSLLRFLLRTCPSSKTLFKGTALPLVLAITNASPALKTGDREGPVRDVL